MNERKSGLEWQIELNKLAQSVGCRVVYKWWWFHVYKKDPETGQEYHVKGLNSIKDIKNFLHGLSKKEEKE